MLNHDARPCVAAQIGRTIPAVSCGIKLRPWRLKNHYISNIQPHSSQRGFVGLTASLIEQVRVAEPLPLFAAALISLDDAAHDRVAHHVGGGEADGAEAFDPLQPLDRVV